MSKVCRVSQAADGLVHGSSRLPQARGAERGGDGGDLGGDTTRGAAGGDGAPAYRVGGGGGGWR